jgi:serine/threonine protein kinase/WD40 repeat protein
LLQPGTRVDHFELIRPLGEGGFGQVWLARDLGLGRKVALKFVLPDRLGDRKALDRFLFEARTTARFNHPNIVQIFHVGEFDGAPYVALEYLEGQPLGARLAQGTPGPAEAARIGVAIARALTEAHGAGVLHRDLKPDNVVIGRDGRPRVLDFGLAKVVDRAAPELPDAEDVDTLAEGLTAVGTIVGTPGYMAPEQLDALPLTAAADVWALGVLLFELLVGRRPFEGRGLASLRQAVHTQAVPPLDGAPEALAELIHRCLRRDPAQRPGAATVAAELDAFLHPARSRRSEDSPFRGLRAFDERHAELFFGRDSEITALVETLRERPVVPIVGPSGAGKSSLILGGLLPRLRQIEPWTLVSLRPGSRPFETLESRLVSSEDTVSVSVASGERDAPSDLFESPRRLGLRLRQMAAEAGTKVLLVVDQLEEIFTLVPDDAVRRRFMQAVCTAADEASDPVRVVFTLRDDFLGRVAVDAEVRAVLGQLVLVRAPEPDALAQTLTEPVALRGYSFDDGVVDEMVAEVAGMEASLPLLQFAGTALWERRDVEGRRLTRAACEAIGGVAGALAHHADAVLQRLPPEQLKQARLLLLRLVTPDHTRRVVPREALLAGLDAEPVLARLVDARLLTRRRGEGGGLVELAHESLIDRWRQLARWLRDAQDEVRALAELEQATSLWAQRGRRGEEVWTGDALQEALKAVSRMDAPPPSVVAFLDAGKNAQRRKGRVRRALLGIAFATLIVVAAASIWTALQFREREAEAVRLQAEQEVALLLAQARELDGGGRRSDAVALLRGAVTLESELGLQDEGTAAVSMLRRLAAAGFLRRTIDVGTSISDVAVHGRMVSIGDSEGQLRWFDLEDGTTALDRPVCRGRWYSADFGADGRLARGCRDGVIEIRRPDGSLDMELSCGEAHIESVRWHPLGFRAVAADGRYCAWGDLRSPGREVSLGHGVEVVTYSADGSRMAAAALPRDPSLAGLSVIDLDRNLVLNRLPDPSGLVRGLVLDGSGDRVFVRTQNQQTGSGVTLGYDVRRGSRLLENQQAVWSGDIAISPDGTQLLQATDEAEVLDAVDGSVLHTVHRPTRPTDSTFSPDGGLGVTGDWDGELQVIDARLGRELHREQAHGVRMFRPLWLGAERFLTWSQDGTLSVWSARRQIVRGWEVPGGASSVPKRLDHTFVVGGGRGGLHALNGALYPTPSPAAVSDLAVQGRNVLVGQSDGTVSLYVDRRLEWSRRPVRSPVHGVGLTDTHAVVAGEDGVLRTLSLDNPDQQQELELATLPVRDLVTQGGRAAAITGGTGTLGLLTPSGTLLGPFDLGAQSLTPAFSPDGSLLATPFEATRLTLIDPDTGDRLWTSEEQHASRIQAMAWSPSGDRLVTGSMDRTLRVWDIKGRRLERVIEPDRGQIVFLEFIDERRALVGTRDDSLEVWDLETVAATQALQGYDGWVSGVARIDDRIAYAHRELGVTIARLAPPQSRTETLEHTGAATNLRVCRDSLTLVGVVPFPEPATVWAPTESCGSD